MVCPVTVVTSYNYLCFIIDEELSFKLHVKNLISKLRVKLGFYYRHKSCFSLRAWRLLISATF